MQLPTQLQTHSCKLLLVLLSNRKLLAWQQPLAARRRRLLPLLGRLRWRHRRRWCLSW
jgi:hypothetical protein